MAQLIEFIGNHWILSSAFAFLVVLFITNEIRQTRLGIKKLSPQAAVQLINRDKVTVLDVRGKTEYDKGHVVNAIHIPLAELNDKIKKLEKAKQNPILITCDMGNVSTGAGTTLRKHGFEQLYAIAGGLNAWKSEHMPLVK